MESEKNKKEYPSIILSIMAQVSHDISPLRHLAIQLMMEKKRLTDFRHFSSSRAFSIFITQPNSQTCKIRTETIKFSKVIHKVELVSQIPKTKST